MSSSGYLSLEEDELWGVRISYEYRQGKRTNPWGTWPAEYEFPEGWTRVEPFVRGPYFSFRNAKLAATQLSPKSRSNMQYRHVIIEYFRSDLEWKTYEP